MNILVTGASGFIGTEVCRQLVQQGDAVIAVSRNGSAIPGCNAVRCDIREQAAVDKVFATFSVDAVVHLAAYIPTDVKEEPLHYQDIIQTNAIGIANVLSAAQRHGVRRFIYGSSMSVFEGNICPQLAEEDPVAPVNLYAITKYAGERCCQFYNTRFMMDICTLRFAGVFGVGRRHGAVYTFLKQALQGKDLVLEGAGMQTHDFVYVKDVAKAILLCLQKRLSGYNLFHIGSGKEISIVQLAQIVQEKVFKVTQQLSTLRPVGSEERSHFCFSIAKAKTVLGFVPTELDDALAEMIQIYSGTPDV